MLMEGKDVLETAPWLSLYPGLAILITVLGYNLLGESLRERLILGSSGKRQTSLSLAACIIRVIPLW